MQTRSILAMFAVVTSAVVVVACSSDEGGGGAGGGGKSSCSLPAQPSPADLSKPVVSFKGEIEPILARSCAFNSCHNVGAKRLVLAGPSARANMLGASATLPSMKNVSPGEPDKSFLMHKLDGTQCSLDAQCAGGTCQDPMPKGGEPLPASDRDAFRRWIAQGAKDD